jgi:hypothetical protein
MFFHSINALNGHKKLKTTKCRAFVQNTKNQVGNGVVFTCHIWKSDEKNEKNIADFQVLGLFMTKKHDLSDKKNSVCHVAVVG